MPPPLYYLCLPIPDLPLLGHFGLSWFFGYVPIAVIGNRCMQVAKIIFCMVMLDIERIILLLTPELGIPFVVGIIDRNRLAAKKMR